MKALIPLLVFLLCSPFARGQDPEELEASPPAEAVEALGDLPVLYNGRVMPLDTFARLHLLQFSGRKSYEGESAMEWMARLLFDPHGTEDDLVFLIDHPELLDHMEVDRKLQVEGERKPSTRRFNLEHLRPGLMKLEELAMRARERDQNEEELGKVEQEAMRVYSNVLTYRMLGQVFAYARPLPGLKIENPEILELLNLSEDAGPLTYMDLGDRVGNLSQMIQDAQAIDDPEQWTEAQRTAFALASMMFTFSQNLSDLPLKLLPAAPHGEQTWLAPFDALHNSDQDRQLIRAARNAGELAQAWSAGDWDEVTQKAEAVSAFSQGRMDHVREAKLAPLEADFNQVNPFGKAKVGYLLAFLLSLGALVSGNRALRLAAWVPLAIALVMHVGGIAVRVYLTARPPVTNLYGTFLFVGLICLLLALLVEGFQKNALGLFAGSFIALTFLFIADRFAAEGDTLHKVVAVLASNFWLSTHVIAVTTGYAGVWIAGVFGHIWLVCRLLDKPKSMLEQVRLPMEGLLGFGLTFAFLGTMLGGVWADQSWGRFWGWDPKENGALLIVLWTAAIYHARVAGMIREKGMAVGTVIGCIMVMLAWLGVNLLGVGLHSYGFTNAMLALFFGYIAFELTFLAVMLILIRLRDIQRLNA